MSINFTIFSAKASPSVCEACGSSRVAGSFLSSRHAWYPVMRGMLQTGGAERATILASITQSANRETVEALRIGVHDFIEKPFTRERLLQSIRNALEREARRRSGDAFAWRPFLESVVSHGTPPMPVIRDILFGD